jgi:bacterioferritin (cytochrome b1)
MLSENEQWLLSYYRASEITGAMFFGRIAKLLKPGPLQADLTQHFADEAQHAAWFTECMESLGAPPLKLSYAYQDDYLRSAGVPTNLMEILSITQVFEKRVLNTYARHVRFPGARSPVVRVLKRIMRDESWHVQWVRQSLKDLEPTYGKDHIAQTVSRHTAADRVTYERFIREYGQRIEALIGKQGFDDQLLEGDLASS